MSETESEWLGGARTAAYLGVTAMTIWRWERDPKLAFPRRASSMAESTGTATISMRGCVAWPPARRSRQRKSPPAAAESGRWP